MSTLVYRLVLEDKGILPASAVGLLVLNQLRQEGVITEADLVIAVITGKGNTESIRGTGRNRAKIYSKLESLARQLV